MPLRHWTNQSAQRRLPASYRLTINADHSIQYVVISSQFERVASFSPLNSLRSLSSSPFGHPLAWVRVYHHHASWFMVTEGGLLWQIWNISPMRQVSQSWPPSNLGGSSTSHRGRSIMATSTLLAASVAEATCPVPPMATIPKIERY
jgi:hypothetical protein